MKNKQKMMKKVIPLYLVAMMFCTLFTVVTQAAPKGFIFTYQKVSVAMNGKAAALIKKAGKPVSKTESKSCAFKGMDRIYTYDDFNLTTYSNSQKGEEYVNGIEILTSKISTAEGITIGSTEAQMIKAYGKSTPEFGVYTYEKGPSKLILEIEEKKVISIKYLVK